MTPSYAALSTTKQNQWKMGIQLILNHTIQADFQNYQKWLAVAARYLAHFLKYYQINMKR